MERKTRHHPLVRQIRRIGRDWVEAQHNPNLTFDEYIAIGKRMMAASYAVAAALKEFGVCGDCREHKQPTDFDANQVACRECVTAAADLSEDPE